MLTSTLLPREHEQGVQWYGTARVSGRDPIHKNLLLTVCLLGLQIVWSTEFAQAAPYLLTLGLSKSSTSLVFLAGPLAGLIVQPLCGSYSDNCKASLGRRRPFIIAGGVLCVCSLFLFGYAHDIAGFFAAKDTPTHNTLALWLAIVSIYVLDFSINAVQAIDRAIIVDTIPASQQEETTAWAGRMLGMGSVVGYLISGSNLTAAFGWISSSQIKLISLLAIATFISTHAITCYSVTERVLLANSPSHSSSLRSTIRSIWATFRQLPLPIWRVMQAQLCSWIAMFALMFYSSTWVAEIYLRQYGSSSGDLSAVDETVSDAATRAGSRALLLQSLVVVATGVIAPFLVTSTGAAQTRAPPQSRFRFVDSELAEDDLSARVLSKLDAVYEWFHRRLPALPLPWLSLPIAWGISQVAFSVLMFSTWFVSGVIGASIIIALSGLTMGMAMWAPFALLGELILLQPSGAQPLRTFTSGRSTTALPLSPIPEEEEEDAKSTASFKTPEMAQSTLEGGDEYKAVASDDASPVEARPATRDSLQEPGKEAERPRVLQLRHSDSFDQDDRPSFVEERDLSMDQDLEEFMPSHEKTADSAGTILGIHNICIVLPQLFTTFVSSVLFAFMAPSTAGTPTAAATAGDSDAIGLVLRLGGIATCFAAWFCLKMDREEKERLRDFIPA